VGIESKFSTGEPPQNLARAATRIDQQQKMTGEKACTIK